jgi:hypothetical protein
MIGFTYLLCIGAYILLCVWPGLALAAKHFRVAGERAWFVPAAAVGLLLTLAALFLYVYLDPLLTGKANGYLMPIKHVLGLHTLALLFLNGVVGYGFLSRPSDPANGFFFGVGISTVAWLLLIRYTFPTADRAEPLGL